MGSPRSLHGLARSALDIIYGLSSAEPQNLDDYFPWVQYAAAHSQSTEIIGCGLTHARAEFVTDWHDANHSAAISSST